MNKFLVNLCCVFIVKKKNRHHFRDTYRNKGIIESLLFSGDTLRKIDKIDKIDKMDEGLTIYKKLQNRVNLPWYPLDLEAYDYDKQNLLKGLSTEATKNCQKLLNRIDKSICGCFEFKDVFTVDEIVQQRRARYYLSKIKFIGDEKYKNMSWDYIAEKVNNDSYYELDGYKLPVYFFEASVHYYKHGIDTLKTKLAQDKAIIDVGCCVADSVCVFKRFYPNNKVYTFEPTRINYELAKQTIKLNDLQDVVIENIGLGSEQTQNLKMIHCDKNIGGSSIRNGKEGDSIVIDTLDNYVSKYNIKVGMIKVDIEGYEQEFLKGAKQTILEQKPIMLLSIYHNYNDFFKIKLIIESWNMGYKFDFFKGEDGSTVGETLLICEMY